MAQNNNQQQGSSPLDLGAMLMNANSNMLNGGQGQQNQNAVQTLLQKNPATGLTDDQAAALSAVIKTARKEHAQEAFAHLGPDQSAALIALHNLTSPTQQEGGGPQSTSSAPAATSTSSAPSATQSPGTYAPPPNYAYDGGALGHLMSAIGIGPSPALMNARANFNLSQQQAGNALPQNQIELDKQKALQIPLNAEQAATVGVKRATMLMDYGGKVSEDFQKTIQPHIDMINTGLTVNNLYKNLIANPNDQQAQQAFLEASAQLQGVKNAKDLMQGRSALAAGFGALNQVAGGGGYQMKELNRIQKANISKYNASQSALNSLTSQHQDRLKKLGIDPDQFINKYGSQQSGQYVKTGSLPDGRKVGMKADGTTEIINAR